MNNNVCSNCGTPNITNQPFCSNCGRPLIVNQTVNPGNQPSMPRYGNAAPGKSRAGLYLGILAGVGLLILLVGAAGLGALYYFISADKREVNYNPQPSLTPLNVKEDNVSPDNRNSSKNDPDDRIDTSEDGKYRLFYAASKAGDQALTLKVSKRIGIISEAGSPTPYYKTFLGGMIEWSTSDIEFVQRMNTKEKALDYINSQAPGLTDSSSRNSSKTVSLGVVNGKATNLVAPAYPAAARAVKASGEVNVEIIIDEQGNVTFASAVSGHPLLRASAERAARASKFSPTILSGKAVRVSGVIVYNFSAQ